jgi:hypothetical protein
MYVLTDKVFRIYLFIRSIFWDTIHFCRPDGLLQSLATLLETYATFWQTIGAGKLYRVQGLPIHYGHCVRVNKNADHLQTNETQTLVLPSIGTYSKKGYISI